MKRLFLAIPLLLVSIVVFSQHSLESSLNMYRVDDIIVKQQVEYKDPGRMGEHVLWDFSRLNLITNEYELGITPKPSVLLAMKKNPILSAMLPEASIVPAIIIASKRIHYCFGDSITRLPY